MSKGISATIIVAVVVILGIIFVAPLVYKQVTGEYPPGFPSPGGQQDQTPSSQPQTQTDIPKTSTEAPKINLCGNNICNNDEDSLVCPADCTPLSPTKAWSQTSGPYGGVITSLIVHDDSPSIIFAGTTYHDGGGGEGIFKSVDSGKTWENVVPHDHEPGVDEDHGKLHDLKHAQISKLVFHPDSPSTIFAATQEKGFYKTDDGGTSWSVHNTGLDNLNIEDFDISKSDPAVLYLGMNDRVYKSTDGGLSWSRTSDLDFAPEQYPLPAFDAASPRNFNSVAVHPTDSDVVYVGTGGGFIKTIDGGKTWKRYSQGLDRTDVAAVAVDPSNPDVVYLTLGEYDTIACNHADTDEKRKVDCGGVMKSTDGGETWKESLRGIGDTLGWVLVIDQKNPSNVYASFGHKLFQSKDNGLTWKNIFPGDHEDTIADVDVFSFIVDPSDSNILYIGTRSGIYKSTDHGRTWEWNNQGLIDSDIFALKVSSADHNYVYAGTKCGTGMFRSTDGGASWNWINYKLGNQYIMDIEVMPDNPEEIFITTNMGIYHSTNAGASWNQIKNNHFGYGEGHTHLHGMAIDMKNPDVIYVGGGGDEYAPSGSGMFKSEDGGGTWRKINDGFVADVHVSSVEIDPFDSNVIYVGTQGPTELHSPSGPGAGIFKSIDAGETWTQINNGLNPLEVSWIAINPADSQIVYAGTDTDGMYKSTNGGEAWKEINNGLMKPIGIGQIVIDVDNPNIIYATSVDSERLRRERGMIQEQGIFVSYDAGESWEQFNEKLENLGVYSLAMDNDVLYAGAKGGGVHWREKAG